MLSKRFDLADIPSELKTVPLTPDALDFLCGDEEAGPTEIEQDLQAILAWAVEQGLSGSATLNEIAAAAGMWTEKSCVGVKSE